MNYAYDLCFEYIEIFYNTIRIHSQCGYESPNQYENNYY
ncbi:IS3 family transposase [uncultured Holdemanella sp.]